MPDPDRRAKVSEPEAPVMVRVENITKKFGNFCALDNVSFHIRQGEILGFLGPNGAGKTTAMRILTGFFPPTEGRVLIHNQELFKEPREVKKRIGYLPESVSIYPDMQVREFLAFVASIRGLTRGVRDKHVDEKLVQCGLWDVQRRLIKNLSKGFRQRIGLAQALVGDPEVLVLDEPTSSLDPRQIIEIRTLIRELGRERTVIISTHILPEVSMVCDRVMIINKGRLVASGTTDDLEATLKDRHEIFVMMGDRHRKADALRLLEGLPGVERVNVNEEHNDRVVLSLGVSKQRDIRPDICRIFVETGIPLFELRSSKLSLEEIFLKIVVDETKGRGMA